METKINVDFNRGCQKEGMEEVPGGEYEKMEGMLPGTKEVLSQLLLMSAVEGTSLGEWASFQILVVQRHCV